MMATAVAKRSRPSLAFHEDLSGSRFLFLGRFAAWPRVLGGRSAEEHVEARRGRVVDRVEDAQYLVVGDGRAKGRAEALRKVEKLKAKGTAPIVLDHRAFLHLARPNLAGLSFLLAGRFSADLEGPVAVLAAAGARVAAPDEPAPDFWVVGDRPGRAKPASLQRLQELQERGEAVRVLSEDEFLELVRLSQGPQDSAFDVRSLAIELRTLTDARKVDRAIQMLKKERFQLYSEATEASLRGIVRSQTHDDAFYACWIDADGGYGCHDNSLGFCWGQSGQMCKHLVVLLIGLCTSREIAARRAYEWARAASRRKPDTGQKPAAELILRHRGAEAGEIDWRPTETVPEDYYAL